MDGVKNKSPIRGEEFAAFEYFLADIFRCTHWQSFLRVNTAAQKTMRVTVFFLQMFGVHAFSGALHRVEDIESASNKGIDKYLYRAAGVFEGFPGGVLVNPIIHLFVVWGVKAVKRFDGAEGGVLSTKVGAANKYRAGEITNPLCKFFAG